MCLHKIQDECDLQLWTDSPLNVDQSEGHTASGEAVQGCVPYSLQLWQALHWGDSGNENEGALCCLREGDVGEVSSCRIHMGGT